MKMHKHGGDNEENDSNNNHKIIDTSRNKVMEDSPLRVALASSNMGDKNPLLTASLNSPPVASNSSNSLNISANGSVDLTNSLQRKRMLDNDNGNDNGNSQPSSSTNSNKEMYANLLMQLRHQGITASEEIVSLNNNNKMSAAARKEKLKSQLCFQCPVCKKRFQRHIAMNAHFQAEHLGATPKNDKVCKLCSYVGQDMVTIRNHLVSKHNIDLETPTACLVEPEMYSNRSSNSSSPLPSSSSDKKSNKPSVSIIRTSVVPKSEDSSISSTESNVVIHETSNNNNYVLKQEDQEVVEEARDLSMKKSMMKRSSSTSPGLDLVHNHSKKRLKIGSGSTNRIVMSSAPSSPMETSSSSSNITAATASSLSSQWQCQHCNIIFPDQTLYFLHRGFHSNTNPWKCNGCGQRCTDMYDFNTHLMSDVHH